jgi:hypothetical protein
MGQAFRSDVQIVEVRTDDHVRGIARREFWAVAAPPEQALILVLARPRGMGMFTIGTARREICRGPDSSAGRGPFGSIGVVSISLAAGSLSSDTAGYSYDVGQHDKAPRGFRALPLSVRRPSTEKSARSLRCLRRPIESLPTTRSIATNGLERSWPPQRQRLDGRLRPGDLGIIIRMRTGRQACPWHMIRLLADL